AGAKRSATRSNRDCCGAERTATAVPLQRTRPGAGARVAAARIVTAPDAEGRDAAPGTATSNCAQPGRVHFGIGTMSVITTWEAVPNRIEAVARYVRTHRGISTDELYELLSPSTLATSSNVVSRVVQESRRLGVIEADDENHWTITVA